MNGEQNQICVQLKRFYIENKNTNHFITVGGYAGTGKTYMISNLREYLSSPRIAYISFTGKAAAVLKTKLEEAGTIESGDSVSTIHRLIYYPKEVIETRKIKGKIYKYPVTKWVLRKTLNDVCDLIVIDESSMVPKKIWEDLLSFKKPIIAVGDHGQLPPVESEKTGFSLMNKPMLFLTKVHRQSKESPILRAATEIRETGKLDFFDSKHACKMFWSDDKCKELYYQIPHERSNNIILCYENFARVNTNIDIRKHLGFDKNKLLESGERLICLKNNHETYVMNGQLSTLNYFSEPPRKDVPIQEIWTYMDDSKYEYYTLLSNHCFNKKVPNMSNHKLDGMYYRYQEHFSDTKITWIDYFDYGYAATIHKAQGSEWDIVTIWEPGYISDIDLYKRLLYTAITRAKKKLLIIV